MGRKLSRREFLKMGVAGSAVAVLAGCQNPRRWVELEPYVHSPEEQVAGVASWYATTCRQCPAGCGVIVRIMNGRAKKIEGNPAHPLNQGKLCARGQAGLQVLYNPDRLAAPAGQDEPGSRNFQSISWEEALNTLTAQLQAAGSSIQVWLGSTTSGHVYDLFQRFTKSLSAPEPIIFDLYTAYHGYRTLREVSQDLFGQDQLPAYDLGQADVIFSFGADFLGTWLSSTRYGIEFGRFRNQLLGKRGYLVQLEPRMSITGAKADKWLPLRPGTEGMVAQAIAYLIASRKYGSAERVERAQALAAEVDVEAVAKASDIPTAELDRLAQIYATTERPIALPGSAISGQNPSAEAVTAVQVLNMIAGVLGQPGGLLLAPKTSLPAVAQPVVSSFAEVQQLIARMEAGQVQVLLVHGANPAYDLPEQTGFVKALQNVPYVVSFNPIVDETAVWADLILPDRTYLESWGLEAVNPNFGRPVVSSQQPVVEPLFGNYSAADALLTIARGLPAAAEALPWQDEAAYLKEAIGGLAPGELDGTDPEVRWARFRQNGGWWSFSEAIDRPDIQIPAQPGALSPAQFNGAVQEYPLYLHIFMSDLLSDGRGASQPWLQGSPDVNTSISWQTWVELNPVTAQQLGLQQGDVVRVTSPFGELEAPVYLYPAVRPDTVAIPLGQGHTDYGRYARDRGNNVINLVGVDQGQIVENLPWAVQRVKIAPTGRRIALATFENSIGVEKGFINRAFPGQ